MSATKKCWVQTRFLVVVLCLLAGTYCVTGATQVVTKTGDTDDGVCDSDCSLREAIAAAGSGDTVTFDPDLFMTPRIIHLGSMLLIDKNITIHGVGGVIIDGNNVCRVLDVNNLGTATITDLTITGGNGSGIVITNDGGAIINSGNLTLVNVTVTGNSTSGNGGGIANGSLQGATMSIVNSTISDNSANGTVDGGGIYSVNSVLNVVGSTVSSNLTGLNGGGIYSQGGTLTINEAAIVSNRSSFDGGGVFGVAAISNTTISGNRASQSGGGFNGGGTLTNVTITNNALPDNIVSPGAGIHIPIGSLLTMGNSIVAGNSITGPVNPTNGRDISGAFTSNGNNLVQVRNGSSGYIASDLPDGTDPLLGQLTNNAGLSPTRALQINSPAIDAGNNVLVVGPNDQRGSGFTRIVTGTVDIGAFEVQGPTAAPVVVQGKVTRADGGAIYNARVRMTGLRSVSFALTNPFGYFRMANVEAGGTYILDVTHKRYTFLPQVVNVNDAMDDLNVTAKPDY